MLASRTLHQRFLALVFVLLAACGGDGSGTLKPSATYPTNVPVAALVTLDGSASVATDAGNLTYNWVLTSKPAGSSATLTNPTAATATFTADVAGTYAFSFSLNNGTQSQTVTGTITAVAFTPPTVLTDIVEPLSGSVQLSVSTTVLALSTVNWSVDGTTIGTGEPLTWDTTTVANGSHVVVAQIQESGYSVSVSRTLQVGQTTVSFTSEAISESAGVFTTIVVPQSANGIIRVTAALDGTAVGTLTAPNTCVDPTGAACATTGLNGYSFTGPVGSGQHVVLVTATDGGGNSLATQLRLNVTDVP